MNCPNQSHHSRTTDLTGRRYFRLTVIRFAGYANGRAHWVTRCECGNEIIRSCNVIMGGRLKSCGCLKKETKNAYAHGHARPGKKTPTYRTWVAMRSRCNNPKVERYENYGGRGIRVCDRWSKFENFLADMGERPAGMSIDRIDNDGHYCPENCRWATNKEQLRNQRKTVNLTYRGETKTRQEWCEIYGLSFSVLRHRLERGWSVERALTTQVQQSGEQI